MVATFIRTENNDFYAVFKEGCKFKIGIYLDGSHLFENPIPYHVLDLEFDNEELAHNVCKVISDEVRDAFSECAC